MRTRKISLILASLLCILMLFGCSNKTEEYSGGDSNSQTTNFEKVIFENTTKNTVEHTSTTENQTTRISTKKPTNVSTTVEIRKEIVTTYETTVNTVKEASTAKMEATSANPIPTAIEPETEAQIIEPITEEITAIPIENIPDNSFYLKGLVMPVTFATKITDQEMIDNNDVVYDPNFLPGSDNILVMGHNYKSFGVLDSVRVGDNFVFNDHGTIRYFEVERSERAELIYENTDVRYSDGTEILWNDFGYPALILFTCDKQDVEHYRWIVVAKEIV